MNSHDTIKLAFRTFAKQDPIDKIFSKANQLNKARIANQLQPIISLCVGEPHLNVNPSVLKALSAFLNEPSTAASFGYSQLQGRDETLEMIAKLYQHYYPNANYTDKEVMICNGAAQGLWNALAILVNPEDTVLVFEPYYSTYKNQVEFFNGKLLKIPTKTQSFRPCAQVLEEYLIANPHAKAIIFNYPNNPTGIDLTKQEACEIACVLKKYPHIAMIVDDVYRELANAEHYTVLDVEPSLKSRCIMINSASKGLIGAPDMRIGMIGARAEWIEKMTMIQATVVSSISLLTQQSVITAIKSKLANSPEYQTWASNAKAAYVANSQFVAEQFKAMGFETIHGGHGLFLVASLNQLIGQTIPDEVVLRATNNTIYTTTNLHHEIGSKVFRDDNDIALYLLYAAQVAVVPGSGFGIDANAGCIRISCAKAENDLAQALDNIKQALGAVNAVQLNPSKGEHTQAYSSLVNSEQESNVTPSTPTSPKLC